MSKLNLATFKIQMYNLKSESICLRHVFASIWDCFRVNELFLCRNLGKKYEVVNIQ